MPSRSRRSPEASAPGASGPSASSQGAGPGNAALQGEVGADSGEGTPTLDLAGPTEWGGQLLRRGSRGDGVAALQRGLSKEGVNTEVDGAFGRGTRDAVRTFQGQAGLSVDGIAGPETEAALNGRPAPAAGGKQEAEPESGGAEESGGSGQVDERSFLDEIGEWMAEFAAQAQQPGQGGGQVDAGGAKQETGAASDGIIQDEVAQAAEAELPGTTAGQSVPEGTTDDQTLAWIQNAGDASSLYPPELKKAYDQCVDLARKGKLRYPGSGTDAQTAPYRRFIRKYKDWLKERFGQQERRINKEIVKLGGSKATALNIERYIAGRLKNVPAAYSGRSGMRLLDKAAASMEEMGKAAAADGVDLQVISSYRKPKNKKPSNTAAVAANSSHSYGVAIDLQLSDKSRDFKVTEIKTGDANNLMKYFGAPVTKWMMANGAKFGWHPYTNEPWHFEYNPEGRASEIVKGALG